MRATKYITPAEAAAKLGITERTLENWRTLNKGPAWVKVNNKTVYESDLVSAYVSKQPSQNYWTCKDRAVVNWRAPGSVRT